MIEKDLPGAEELVNDLKLEEEDCYNEDFENVEQEEVVQCIDCKQTFTIQSELEKFMKLQDSGLDTNFKCPKCRDCKSCLKGSGQEILSMKEEFEQQVVESSIRIDKDLEQSIAFLAFIADPDENLAENDYIAIKRLNNLSVLLRYRKS